MKIGYAIVEAERVSVLEKDPKVFLENTLPSIATYDHICVYRAVDARFEYYGNFKVEKDLDGKIRLLRPKGRLKRPIDRIHKFWARKPWWAVSQYILTYSKEGDVVCDPMCGCGIAGYEALRLGRKAVLVDLNPFAIFLAKNTIKPINLSDLADAYEQVLNRPIQMDIKINNATTLIEKGKSVRDTIRALYKTKCPICKGAAEAVYYIWDTIYEYKGLKSDNKESDVLLKAISRVAQSDEHPKELTQIFLLTNWQRILEEARNLWEERRFPVEENPFKGPPRPGAITNAFGKLVREGVYSRIKREPTLLYYACLENKKHKGLVSLSDVDRELVSLLEMVQIPFIYPSTSLRYPDGQLFDTARPDSLFIEKELLSTWSKDEQEKQEERFNHLFTKRNLLALSILFWSIEQVRDPSLRELLLLAFTQSLYKASKLNSYEVQPSKGRLKIRRATLWRENRFSIPPDFAEENVFVRFDREFASLYEAKEQAISEIKSYREANSVDEFVKSRDCNVLYLRTDARDVSRLFEAYKDIVDMIFTDPPYGDAIQYYELCMFWVAWLCMDKDWSTNYGNSDWWRREVVVNKVQGKPSLDNFKQGLTEIFQSVRNIVSDEATWVITYHKREPGYWKALMDAQLSIGLAFFDEDRHQLLGRSFNPSKDFKFLETDAYTIWKSFPVQKVRTFEEAAESFFNIVGSFVVQHNGILPRNAIEKAYVEMAWNVEKSVYEQFFEGKYDVFLEKHSIQIFTKNGVFVVIRRDSPPPGVSSEKWQALWDACYGRVDPELLIKYSLAAYIKGRYEREMKTSLDDIYHDIVSRIDGRISQDIVFTIIDEIAEYDWLEGTYKPRKEVKKIEGLAKWMPKKELKLPEPPESLIPKLTIELIKKGYEIFIGKGYEKPDISRVYERKIVKRIRSDLDTFPIVITKNGIPIACIDVNTLGRASHALLKGDVKIIVLYAMEEIVNKSSFYKKHLDEGKLVLLDVQNKTTTDVIDAITRQIEE